MQNWVYVRCIYIYYMRAKKSVPDKKRDVGMEGFYKRQSHTYVIASTGCYQSPLAIT